MIQSFVGCFTLQGADEVRISNSKKEKLNLFSIHRIKKHNSQDSDPSSSNITLIFECKEDKQQKTVSTIRLDGNKSFRILNQIFQSHQISVTKTGADCIQLFFTSEIVNPHIFFTFYGSPNQESKNTNPDQNDKKIVNSQIPLDMINSIVIELQRIKKSSNQLLLLCIMLHSFFPSSFFTGYNPKRMGKDYHLIILEKVLYVFYNRINNERIFDEFKKCIDYIDFQISIDNEISFGIGIFIISFFHFYRNQIFYLSKFLILKKNFVTFLSLLTYLPKPIDETFFSYILSFPLESSLVDQQQSSITLSTLYQFLLINCIKNKSKIFFHFTYLNLLQKVATLNELEFFIINNNVIGIDDFIVSECLKKPKLVINESLVLNYPTSPLLNLKKEKILALKVEKCFEFEKNEVFKASIYNGWFKMKLSKHVRRYCRYAPIYIRPLQDTEEDNQITIFYIFLSVFCLLFSIVVIWKFSLL